MTDRPLISATLICRDEEDNVETLLASIWDHVDQVVVVDTGSTDGTVDALERFAERSSAPEKLTLAEMEWDGDFAAARNYADSLAAGEWLLWADLDDVVEGAAALRQLAADADEQVLAFFCQYVYATDTAGATISELWRERLVRNTGVRWNGRLHETKLFTGGGQIVKVDPQIARWIHRRDHTQRTAERNLAILEAWNEQEPGQERVLWALGMEYMAEGRPGDSAEAFAAALEHRGEMQPDRVSQAVRLMCTQLMLQGQRDAARQACMALLAEQWMFADQHLTLAEIAHDEAKPAEALHHAATALSIGAPDTLLITNPLQYSAHPRALMAVSLAQLGRLEEAVKAGEECVALDRENPIMERMLPGLRSQLQRHQTAAKLLELSQLYVSAGEVAKAHRLVSDLPFFLHDDVQLIQRRGEIARLIAERRRDLAPAHDEAADAFITRAMEAA